MLNIGPGADKMGEQFTRLCQLLSDEGIYHHQKELGQIRVPRDETLPYYLGKGNRLLLASIWNDGDQFVLAVSDSDLRRAQGAQGRTSLVYGVNIGSGIITHHTPPGRAYTRTVAIKACEALGVGDFDTYSYLYLKECGWATVSQSGARAGLLACKDGSGSWWLCAAAPNFDPIGPFDSKYMATRLRPFNF